MTFTLNLPWLADPDLITRDEYVCEDCGHPLVVFSGVVRNLSDDVAVGFHIGDHDHEQHQSQLLLIVPTDGWAAAPRPVKPRA